MIHDLDKFVRFLCRHNITAHEFMLPYMLYLDERDGSGRYINHGNAIARLYQYSEQVRGWTPSEVNNLVRQGLITDDNSTNSEGRKEVSPDMMHVTEKFKEAIFAPETRFEEFTAVYPTMVENFNDPRKPKIPLKIVEDLEALEKYYHKVVKTRALHQQILDVVEWARDRGYIKMNISKFVHSKHWQALLEQRRDEEEAGERTHGIKQA